MLKTERSGGQKRIEVYVHLPRLSPAILFENILVGHRWLIAGTISTCVRMATQTFQVFSTLAAMSSKNRTQVCAAIDATNDTSPPLDFSFRFLAGLQGKGKLKNYTTHSCSWFVTILWTLQRLLWLMVWTYFIIVRCFRWRTEAIIKQSKGNTTKLLFLVFSFISVKFLLFLSVGHELLWIDLNMWS